MAAGVSACLLKNHPFFNPKGKPMSKHSTLVISMIALAILPGRIQAQESAPAPSQPLMPTSVYRYYSGGSLPGELETDKKLQQAIQKYRDAGDDSAVRNESRNEINDLLAEKYDLLLKNQEEELNQLEAKLNKLRNQLKQRRDAKQKMVELKLEMVLAQADGLGWPDSDPYQPSVCGPIAIPINRLCFLGSKYHRPQQVALAS
jgi:hypothetical protein